MAHCWRCGPCCYRPFNTRILTSMGHSRLLQPITLVPYGIPVPVFLLGLFTSGNIITSFDLSKQDRIFHWIRLSILTTWARSLHGDIVSLVPAPTFQPYSVLQQVALINLSLSQQLWTNSFILGQFSIVTWPSNPCKH